MAKVFTDICSLENGRVFFQWPENISKNDCADILEWLDLIKRKLPRFVLHDTAESTPAEATQEPTA